MAKPVDHRCHNFQMVNQIIRLEYSYDSSSIVVILFCGVIDEPLGELMNMVNEFMNLVNIWELRDSECLLS